MSVPATVRANDSAPAAGTASSDPLAGLGRKLFFDQRLSADGKTSCASCHQPQKAFQDGLPVAHGAFEATGTRNTPSLLRVAEQRTFFWDGRRSSLADQALDPLRNPREHGLIDEKSIEQRIDSFQDYVAPLAAAREVPNAGQHTTTEIVRVALAAFESTLVDGTSPFERFRYQGDAGALTPAAVRGWGIFSGYGRCTECHRVPERAPALFTDHAFHALPQRGPLPGNGLMDLVNRFMSMQASGKTLDEILLSDADMASLGRFAVSGEPSDIGAFKTPTLRNVALTAPYMHDGSVATLQDAVDLEVYYRGTRDGHPLILTQDEKNDLLAFLHSLTSFTPPQ